MAGTRIQIDLKGADRVTDALQRLATAHGFTWWCSSSSNPPWTGTWPFACWSTPGCCTRVSSSAGARVRVASCPRCCPPVVLYNGPTRWTAATDVARLIAPVSQTLGPYQPSQRCYLLDEGACGDDDLPRHNLASALIALENSRSSALTGAPWRQRPAGDRPGRPRARGCDLGARRRPRPPRRDGGREPEGRYNRPRDIEPAILRPCGSSTPPAPWFPRTTTASRPWNG